MPIRFGLLDRDLTHDACERIKRMFAERRLDIPRTRFFQARRGSGYGVPIPRVGDLFVFVDGAGCCKISVPVGDRRRYIKAISVDSALTTLLLDYGTTWVRENNERNRAEAEHAQQRVLMQRTLDRVFSQVGLVLNDRRCSMNPEGRSFVCRDVEFQGLTLQLRGLIEDAVPKFTNVTIQGGVSNVRVNKLARALSTLTGQRPCPV